MINRNSVSFPPSPKKKTEIEKKFSPNMNWEPLQKVWLVWIMMLHLLKMNRHLPAIGMTSMTRIDIRHPALESTSDKHDFRLISTFEKREHYMCFTMILVSRGHTFSHQENTIWEHHHHQYLNVCEENIFSISIAPHVGIWPSLARQYNLFKFV